MAAVRRTGQCDQNPEAERLAELPGVVRSRLVRHIREPDEVVMAAEAIRDTLDQLTGDSTAQELRTAGSRLQAYTEYGQLILSHLAMLGGELRGLAWAADVREEGALSTSTKLSRAVEPPVLDDSDR